MITRTILRALWAAIVFVFAGTVALGVLFMLGAAWVGDELVWGNDRLEAALAWARGA